MIALFFEVLPHPGHEDSYFNIAASLKPELEKHAGLIFLDRYRSLHRPGWILSHQYWRDEASMVRWRTNARHHLAQKAGRHEHFADYRLRVARVIVDAAPGQPSRRSTEDAAYNDPALTPPRYVVAAAGKGSACELAGGERYKSVNRADAFVSLVQVPDRDAGAQLVSTAVSDKGATHARLCLISRDYGMHARIEAPQVFPAMATATPS